MKLFMVLATACLIGIAIYLFIAAHRHGKNDRKGDYS